MTLCCVLGQDAALFVPLFDHPGAHIQMATGTFFAGDNPAMDLHPIQRGGG